MRRRLFLGLVSSVALAPLVARAQQLAKMPTIGFMATGPRSTWGPWADAFEERLSQLGWIDGRNVAIEYRWADGRRERFAEFAAEFVRLKVDVIVTSGAAGEVLKRATSTIPIVLGIANDPVGEGLVKSLARPGSNITGISLQASDLAGKRLELMREILPGVRHLGILADVGYPAAVLEMRRAETAARKLGLEVVRLEVRKMEDFAIVFGAYKGGLDALYVGGGPLVTTNGDRITTFALVKRLPTFAILGELVEAGALMSYGPYFPDLFRLAADDVDKILRGVKPSALPIQQPTKFELIINLRTARALGLKIPQTVLMRADKVIE
jgi:putative ABC transport system substrate-binding protein